VFCQKYEKGFDGFSGLSDGEWGVGVLSGVDVQSLKEEGRYKKGLQRWKV